MRKVMLTMLVLGIGAGACATTSNDQVAALEKQLQDKDREIASLKGKDATLRSTETKVDDLSKANQELSQELKNEIARGDVTIGQLKDRLTVSVVQEVLFDSGKAEIHAAGKKVLDRVAHVLKDIDNRLIMVEGHTDNVPIGAKIAERFPTNWELSTARATTVLRYLQEKGVKPEHLGAAGFSEYRPMAPNDTDANRKKNRRIDIVLTPDLQPKQAS
jgi:chemotaxis protein MotB